MIERLADLADEAADKELQCVGEYHPDWHTIRDRKFAEFIVAECAIALARVPHGTDAGIWYANVQKFNKHLELT